jgi:alpha-tubulin suppressor-like RCC1 family protein
MGRTNVLARVLMMGFCCFTGLATVPNPTVTGPIPANVTPGDPSHDYPFFATTVDLAKYGYVEQEFFIEGTANRYSTPALATGGVIDSGHRYRTRMVVRRPASPERFNGTVVMEVYVNGLGREHEVFWIDSPDHFIRRGYAWIGVSVLRLGVHQPATGLRDWSPRRYGTLDVTDGGTVLDDALSYDIISQAAQAVKNPVATDPLGGLRVDRLLAAGGANAANRLALYHNSIHPLADLFDGFLLAAGGGQIRTDLDVKVFKILTETSVAASQAANRQPDSDHLRWWEGAGTSTFDLRLKQGLDALVARDDPSQSTTDCTLPPFSRIPVSFLLNAGIDHMVPWLRYNIPPPSAPVIEIASLGPPVVIARDDYGNARGGIRLPQHAVPTGTNTGVNSGTGLCSLQGSFQAFDNATLAALYPDHVTYVNQVVQATLDNLDDGFVVPEDAAAIIADAVHSQDPGGAAAWYSAIPTQVFGIQGAVAVAGGAGHSAALRSDGTVWTWGNNSDGQLGDGTIANRAVAMQVPGIDRVVAIAAGENHTLALKSDGTVWAWGWNMWGQLGDGTSISRSAPVQVNGVGGVAAIAAGGMTSMAVKRDGTVWTWGIQNGGIIQTGTGWGSPWTPIPVQVSGIGGIVAVAADYDHCLAVQRDGTVWTWGWLGWVNGNPNNYQAGPARVDGLDGVVAATLASGDYLAARHDGTVWEWGIPEKGVQPAPAQVSGLENVIALAGGNAMIGYFCGNCGQRLALKRDGTVWAWGDNADGQLGDGTVGPVRMTPAQVAGLTGVVAVGAGDLHSLAVKGDGTVWAWGNNDSGQLGVQGSRALPLKLPESVRRYRATRKSSRWLSR